MQLTSGVLTVSLDLELYWGVRDKRTIEQYKNNLQGVSQAVPAMLKIFDNCQIHSTWATVGFLFFDGFDTLKNHIPKLIPSYDNPQLSPYEYIYSPENENAIYHFAPELIKQILGTQGQEIGTHTFSHYYCLERGQTAAQFKEDIITSISIAKDNDITLKSLVFPRNQCNPSYLLILKDLGIRCYRGNQSVWFYKTTSNRFKIYLQRLFRLLDTYVNISGHNTYLLKDCADSAPFNFPSSHFLRPYNSKLAILDRLRITRIKRSMTDAAVHKKIFHLWWHPHNFGVNTDKNMAILQEIADHYRTLKSKYNMTSMNMGELSHHL